MARQPNADYLERIYHTVEAYPGKRPGFLARLLGVSRSMITRALPTMEERGYYLSEDERGGLWPFAKRKS